MRPPGEPALRTTSALRLLFALLLTGLALGGWMRGTLLGQYSQEVKGSFFYIWFCRYEIWLLLILMVVPVLALWKRNHLFHLAPGLSLPREMVVITATGTALLLSILGHFAVYTGFPLSMDEYNVVFQSRLFAAGKIWAEIPAWLLPVEQAIRPPFVLFLPEKLAWMSFYQPGFALLYTPGLLAGVPWLLNPLLSAAAVFLSARCAARLFPGCPDAPGVAALLMLGSNQVLFYGMSYYSMPAHLCLNLLWLFLWLKNDRRPDLWAALTGAYALHLHQPNVHALFVLPFLLAMVWRKQWTRCLIYAVPYALSSLFFLWWMDFKTRGQDAHLDHTAGLFTPWLGHVLVQPVNVILFLAWNSLALVFFLSQLKRSVWKDPALGLLLWGITGTILFYFLFPSNQGHGWGYRYLHAVTGNITLLAVAGYAIWSARMPRLALRTAWAGTLIALFLQLPIHAFQARQLIAPLARADRQISALPSSLVILPVRDVWYVQDLLRNDPLTFRPPIRAHDLALPQWKNRVPPPLEVRGIDPAEFVSWGLHPSTPAIPQAPPPPKMDSGLPSR